MTYTKYLDEAFEQLAPSLEGKPPVECYLLLPALIQGPSLNAIMPLAIFKTKEALYEKIESVARGRPVALGIWWFDD